MFRAFMEAIVGAIDVMLAAVQVISSDGEVHGLKN
jgi:hypothetical protein